MDATQRRNAAIDNELLEVIKTQAIETYEFREDNGIDNCGPDFREAAFDLGCTSDKVADRIDEMLTVRMIRARGGV